MNLIRKMIGFKAKDLSESEVKVKTLKQRTKKY